MTERAGSGTNAARAGAAIGPEGGVEEALEGVFRKIVPDVLAGRLAGCVRMERDSSRVARSLGRVSVSSPGISATAGDGGETLFGSEATSVVAGNAEVKDRSPWVAAGISSRAASLDVFHLFVESR